MREIGGMLLKMFRLSGLGTRRGEKGRLGRKRRFVVFFFMIR